MKRKMVKAIRWIIGTILLGCFMLLSILLLAYSLVDVEVHDYQWHITAPVLIGLFIIGAIVLPIKEKDAK